MPGLLDRRNEDVTITRKMGNGSSVTYKSPEGSQVDMDGILGGMIDGYTPTPVSDNKQINVTPGEFVVNYPAAQKYKPLLEQINNEGRQALAMGGWTHGKKGYAEGGGVFDGYANYSQQDFVNEAQPQDIQGGSAAPGGHALMQDPNAPQQYPPQVVLDPNSNDKAEFDRMDQLVRNDIYTIQRDRAGRAIYQLTDLGNSHNVRAQGSGRTTNMSQGQPQGRDNYNQFSGISADPVGDNQLAQLQSQGLVGRGNAVEAPGARADVYEYGQAGSAPSVTPEGTRIQYSAGQSYNVASQEQASQFVAAGIVAVGAQFVLPDGTTGVAK